VEIQNPTFSGGGCSAVLVVNKGVSGSVTQLYYAVIGCRNGLIVRAVTRPGLVYVTLDERLA